MILHHLHLNVRDRARSEAFYQRWFGLQLDRRTDALSFLLDTQNFLLVLKQDPAPEPLPDWFHFGFPQPDGETVARRFAEMVAAGVPVVQPYVVQDSITACRLADPDGHVFELYWLPLGHRSAV